LSTDQEDIDIRIIVALVKRRKVSGHLTDSLSVLLDSQLPMAMRQNKNPEEIIEGVEQITTSSLFGT